MYPIKISDMCIFKLPMKFSSSFVISINALRLKCVLLPYCFEENMYVCIPLVDSVIL